MGDKYIIELEDKPFHKEDGGFLYRVKGFNSLVFDMTGIGKLTPYTEPDLERVRKEGYQQGYEQGYKDGYNEPGKGKIQVGDEVERILSGEVDSKAVFLEDNEGYYRCLFWTGCCFTTLSYPKDQFRKTGRHFDEFATVLEKMREESNG